jgi:hypothetical protein
MKAIKITFSNNLSYLSGRLIKDKNKIDTINKLVEEGEINSINDYGEEVYEYSSAIIEDYTTVNISVATQYNEDDSYEELEYEEVIEDKFSEMNINLIQFDTDRCESGIGVFTESIEKRGETTFFLSVNDDIDIQNLTSDLYIIYPTVDDWISDTVVISELLYINSNDKESYLKKWVNVDDYEEGLDMVDEISYLIEDGKIDLIQNNFVDNYGSEGKGMIESTDLYIYDFSKKGYPKLIHEGEYL